MRVLQILHQLELAGAMPPGRSRCRVRPRGGVEAHGALLAGELERLGHGVLVAAPLTAGPDGHGPELDVAPLPAARPGFGGSLISRGAELAIADLIRSFRPHLVHLHHLMGLSWRLPALCRSFNIPVVLTVHDLWPICHNLHLLRPGLRPCEGPGRGWSCGPCLAGGSVLRRVLARPAGVGRTMLLAQSLRRADAVILPALFLAARLGPLPRAFVVPCGVERALPVAPGGPGPLRVGYLGTLRPHKGVHVLARAAQRLRSLVTLHVHGDPGADEAYARRIGDMGAQLHGPYDRRGLAGLLANLDVVAVPSLWPEVGPLVMYEALAHSVAVLASDLGGPRERLRQGLLPPGDEGAWAEALEGLANDRGRLDALRLAQPRPPSSRDTAAAVEKVYRTVLGLA